MPFDDLLGPDYLEAMKKRLEGNAEELVWPRQARDLLRPRLKKGISVLEVGCCLGTAYRAFEGTPVYYIGLDNEPKYLDVARKWYEGYPNVNFVYHDFARWPLLLEVDVVICSAALEHCLGFQPALKHLVDATRQVLLLRTFLGQEEEIAYNLMPSGERFYTNQYAFRDILGYLAGKGFVVNVYRDRHTDSIPQLQNGQIRTYYFVFAERVVE